MGRTEIRMLYRFELYVDDEYQEVGIFRGINETSISQPFKNCITDAFEELPCPNFEEKAEFYFTEKGLKKFSGHIIKILDVYEDDGLFDVKMVCVDDIPDKDVIYQDDFQAALKHEFSVRNKKLVHNIIKEQKA